MMELTVLGSGTGVPSARRGSPGLLLRAGGRTLLIDCGPGTLRSAAAAGADPGQIDAILLTHLHPDHTLDLPALLFALRNPRYSGRGSLLVAGPRGLSDLLAHWWAGAVHGPWLRPEGTAIDVREVVPGSQDVLGLVVSAVAVVHSAESLAYRIAECRGGPVLAVSGDTGPCEGVVQAGRGADLFVLECALPDPPGWEGHLTPEGAAEVAARAAPRRLLLTHLYPEVEDEPILETVRRRYRGEAGIAEDGTVHTIG